VKITGLAIAVLALSLVSVPLINASTIKLDLPGVESNALVDEVSFGIGGNFSSGGGNTVATKVKISDINISKMMDSSSSKLLLDAAEGIHFPTITLDFFKSSFSTTTPYEEIVLSDALVSNVQFNGLQNEETFSLAYQQIVFKYAGPSGNPLGAFLPLSSAVQDGPFFLNLRLDALRLDDLLGNSDISSASNFAGTVPEPASFTLLASGLFGIAGLIRRKRIV